jgi:hypothetical protein
MLNFINSSIKLPFRLTCTVMILAGLGATACHRGAAIAENAVDAGDDKVAAEKIAEGDRLYEGREELPGNLRAQLFMLATILRTTMRPKKCLGLASILQKLP